MLGELAWLGSWLGRVNRGNKAQSPPARTRGDRWAGGAAAWPGASFQECIKSALQTREVRLAGYVDGMRREKGEARPGLPGGPLLASNSGDVSNSVWPADLLAGKGISLVHRRYKRIGERI